MLHISKLAGAAAAAALAWTALHAQIPTPRPSDAARPGAVAPVAPPQTEGRDDSFPALQRRLSEAMARGDIAGAVTIAERQHRLFPNEMKATADLGDVYLVRGDAARAEPLLRSAITQPSRLLTGSPAPVLGSVYANLGQISLDRGRTEEAIQQLQRAVDYAPTAARARFLLASAFAVAGDAERSGREIRAAFDVDSSVARAGDYLLLARSLRRAGNTAAAADALERAVARYPLDIALRLEAAATYRARKEPVAALYELLYAEMVFRPDTPDVRAVSAAIAELRAEADAAAEPDPRLELVFAYVDDAMTGQHDEALPTLQDLLALETPAPAVPRLLLARSYRATGRMAEAERTLLGVLDDAPSNVPAMVDLADLYFAEGRREAAFRLVARARQFGPDTTRLREVMEQWGK